MHFAIKKTTRNELVTGPEKKVPLVTSHSNKKRVWLLGAKCCFCCEAKKRERKNLTRENAAKSVNAKQCICGRTQIQKTHKFRKCKKIEEIEKFIHFRSPALPADQQWPLPGAEEG